MQGTLSEACDGLGLGFKSHVGKFFPRKASMHPVGHRASPALD
jgi:hypothetical protein